MTYTHCTVTNNKTGLKYLAKVGEIDKETSGPISVLVQGEWIAIKEFAKTCSNYSCDDYRIDMGGPDTGYTHCTVTTEHKTHYFAQVAYVEQKDGSFFWQPILVFCESEWISNADFREKHGDYFCDRFRKITEAKAPGGLVGEQIAEKTTESIMTTFTPQEPYGKRPKPASTEFDAKAFGTLVYLYRTSLLLPKTKAAEQIGINESALAAIENGTYHGIDEIAKAAKWTDLSAQAMGFYFGLKEAKEPEKKRWLSLAIIIFLSLLVAYILVWNL